MFASFDKSVSTAIGVWFLIGPTFVIRADGPRAIDIESPSAAKVPLREVVSGRTVSWHTDYGKAQRLHRERQSLMLVVLTMDGCPYCHKMFEETYRDAGVVRDIRDSFVPTVVHADTQPRLARAFGARIFPTTYLVGPDNKIVDRIDGFVDARQLRQRMAQAVRRYTKVASRPTKEG